MKRKKPPSDAPQEVSAMDRAIREAIRSIPHGKVATYGQVAAAAGYPLYHRKVAQVLRKHGHTLPWHRVLGAGGYIKTAREAALEQRLRLEMEGVRLNGLRVRLAEYQSPLHDDETRTRPRKPKSPRRGPA